MQKAMNKPDTLFNLIANSMQVMPEHSTMKWLTELRKNSLHALQQQTLPTARTEDWRDVYLHNLYKQDWVACKQNSETSAKLRACVNNQMLENVYLLVMVDGYFHSDLSNLVDLPNNILLGNINTQIISDHSFISKAFSQAFSQVTRSSLFAHLNMAWFTGGIACKIPAGVKLQKPIQILSINTNQPSTMSHQRHLIVVEADAAVEIIETQVSLGEQPHFCTDVMQIELSHNARCQHIRQQNCNQQMLRLGHLFLTQEHDSSYHSGFFNFGSSLNRESATVHLSSNKVDCQLYGLYLADQKQCLDHHFVLSHEAESGYSEQYFKGIVAQEARGIFSGKVIVQPGAQKTNTNQVSRNLILGKHAEVINKPELEIYADDVRCTHGSATGQLDKEALFYLQSRGISYAQALSMLTRAFIADVLDKIPDPNMRTRISELAWGKLALQLQAEFSWR